MNNFFLCLFQLVFHSFTHEPGSGLGSGVTIVNTMQGKLKDTASQTRPGLLFCLNHMPFLMPEVV
jgi:hypothetical protein